MSSGHTMTGKKACGVPAATWSPTDRHQDSVISAPFMEQGAKTPGLEAI